MSTDCPTQAIFLDALYVALREHDVGTLPRTHVAIGALDLDHSAIIARVEALLQSVSGSGETI